MTGTAGLNRRLQKMAADYQLYLMLLLPLTYFVIFHYIPIYGLQIAFKNFSASLGIWGSPWVGFQHFERFFASFQFERLLRNTLGISLYQLLVGWPTPIILALLLNQVRNKKFKKTVQTVTFAPYFISVVVLTGMLVVFLSPTTGIVNTALRGFGRAPIYFLGDSSYFWSVFVLSGVWQHAGWGMIIYLAALSNVNPELYEAATVDGATIFQKLRHVDVPAIVPIAVIVLILRMGQIMEVGYQKALLMQNPLNLEASEVIGTYVYKVGLLQAQFSFSTAVNLFNTLINVLLFVSANWIARRMTDNSLW